MLKISNVQIPCFTLHNPHSLLKLHLARRQTGSAWADHTHDWVCSQVPGISGRYLPKDPHTLPASRHTAVLCPLGLSCFSLEHGIRWGWRSSRAQVIWTRCSLGYREAYEVLGNSLHPHTCLDLVTAITRKSPNTALIKMARCDNRNLVTSSAALWPYNRGSGRPNVRKAPDAVTELGTERRGPDNSSAGEVVPRSYCFKTEI